MFRAVPTAVLNVQVRGNKPRADLHRAQLPARACPATVAKNKLVSGFAAGNGPPPQFGAPAAGLGPPPPGWGPRRPFGVSAADLGSLQQIWGFCSRKGGLSPVPMADPGWSTIMAQSDDVLLHPVECGACLPLRRTRRNTTRP